MLILQNAISIFELNMKRNVQSYLRSCVRTLYSSDGEREQLQMYEPMHDTRSHVCILHYSAIK